MAPEVPNTGFKNPNTCSMEQTNRGTWNYGNLELAREISARSLQRRALESCGLWGRSPGFVRKFVKSVDCGPWNTKFLPFIGCMGMRDDDPPLAQFEELVHTNADLSHLVLDGLQAIATTQTRPPRELRLVRVQARRPAGRLDPDPEDGLVRVEVLALGAREVGGLEVHELRAEITEAPKPPHSIAVFTNAPEDARPERWEATLPELADTRLLRVEWTSANGGSVVVAVALHC